MKKISLFYPREVLPIVDKPLVLLAALIFFAVSSIKAQVPDNTYNPAPSAKNHYDSYEPDSLEGEIYLVLEDQPSFPGGKDALNKYVQDNIHYPQLAKEKGIQGRVWIRLVVEKDGSISHVTILRDIGGGCGEEAVRIAKSMPKWKPGKLRGKVVRSQYSFSVEFTLPK